MVIQNACELAIDFHYICVFGFVRNFYPSFWKKCMSLMEVANGKSPFDAATLEGNTSMAVGQKIVNGGIHGSEVASGNMNGKKPLKDL